MAHVQAIADWLDVLLRTSEIPDYPGALNGLQLASRKEIGRVACAVDFSTHIVREAVRVKADMLLVHHGMFWAGPRPVTGVVYEQIATLIQSDIGVYSSHLPLDLHPEIGNNVLLARELGLEPTAGFATFKTIDIGVSGVSDLSTTELADRAREFARSHGGEVVVTPFSASRRTLRWGICTGAGADSNTIREAITRSIDTMIVGEGPHHTAVQARDAGVVIIYAGHYATETLGVRALAKRAADHFEIEAEFLDAPTGL